MNTQDLFENFFSHRADQEVSSIKKEFYHSVCAAEVGLNPPDFEYLQNLLFEGANVNWVPAFNFFPTLFMQIFSNNEGSEPQYRIDLLKFLAKNNAEINQKFTQEHNALTYALVQKKLTQDDLQLLLDLGLDVLCKNMYFTDCLMVATLTNQPEYLAYMIEHLYPKIKKVDFFEEYLDWMERKFEHSSDYISYSQNCADVFRSFKDRWILEHKIEPKTETVQPVHMQHVSDSDKSLASNTQPANDSNVSPTLNTVKGANAAHTHSKNKL